MAKAVTSFEDAIARLDSIVNEIENDQIPLEAALEKYQKGMGLIKFCQEKLALVEQKVKLLDTDTDSLKDFDIE